VNQTTPPGPSGQTNPYGEAGSQPADSGYGGGVPGNAYYGTQQNAPPPDLDANAPLLKSNDLQRLNRKALLFLAGIIALLVLMAFWMFSNAGGNDTPAQPREEAVVVPDLPDASTMAPPAIAEEPAPIEVVDYSQEALPPLPAEPTPSGYSSNEPQAPREPSLMERRMQNTSSGSGTSAEDGLGPANDPYLQAMLAQMQGNEKPAAPEPGRYDAATSARFISKPDALLVRGTYMRCVLETRIVTDVDGFTSCVLTEPTYSINGRNLLLPKGSKLLGQYAADDVSRDRVAVIWDRITTPTGVDVSMASPGIDNLGGAGHPGKRNAHWGSRIASALLISLLSDAFKYAGEKNGPRSTTTYGNGAVVEQPFQSNTAKAVEQLANQAVESSADRPATVTINQGTVVTVYVSKDVDFSNVLANK